MADRVIEEKDISIEDYLKLFEGHSADYELIKKNSDRLSRVVVKKVEDASGSLFEDTTFIEKSGLNYTIRSKID